QLSSHFAAFVLYLLLSSYFLLIYQHPGIFNCFFLGEFVDASSAPPFFFFVVQIVCFSILHVIDET
ncbi:hypothetical protein ACOQLH_34490, partial [Klebsiella pneumoniae]